MSATRRTHAHAPAREGKGKRLASASGPVAGDREQDGVRTELDDRDAEEHPAEEGADELRNERGELMAHGPGHMLSRAPRTMGPIL